MTVLDVFSWLSAKEISIGGLEQIFIKHLNGTYEGEYKVLLEIPDNAKEISIGGLEQIFIKHLNAHMKGNIRYYWKCNCCCRL